MLNSSVRNPRLLAGRTSIADVKFHFVNALIGAGDIEGAMAIFEAACIERNVFVLTLHSDPFYDRLRSNAHFNEVLRKAQLLPAANTEGLKTAKDTAGNAIDNDNRQTRQLPRVEQTRSIARFSNRSLILIGVLLFAL